MGPGSYDVSASFYPRVPNAHLHPLVRFFLHLGNDRIADRYVHLHPEVSPSAVREVLSARPRWLRWSGADLFHVTNERGIRRSVVIETNSSPSGQKSMPLIEEEREQAGYRRLLEGSFLPLLGRRRLPAGDLAVLWDKNFMENQAYAAVLADLTGETVHRVHVGPDGSNVRVEDGVVHVDTPDGWRPLRAAFRYVTQRPWRHFPAITRTAMLNPVLACLAGGRNKLLAARAYALFNARMASTGLRVRLPETNGPLSLREVPLEVERLGGVAVVKVPYSNAGQGVFTITRPDELQAVLDGDHPYDRFIVQALIGHPGWSSRGREGRLYHVGTVPNLKREFYVADLRFMVGAGPDGFRPIALYARRARDPLRDRVAEGTSSWSMLGTNLSKQTEGGWTTEPDRLMLMDSRDFNRLGLGLDDLIEGYLQTVLATLAIDQLADELVNTKGGFRRRLFGTMNPDEALLRELHP